MHVIIVKFAYSYDSKYIYENKKISGKNLISTNLKLPLKNKQTNKQTKTTTKTRGEEKNKENHMLEPIIFKL